MGDNMYKSEKIILYGIIGMTAGFVLGTVFAPWSGEELQKKIGMRKRTIEEKLKKLESKLDKLEKRIQKDKEK